MGEPRSTLPGTPRWQRRPADRPDEILDAALVVFGEAGFARAKLEDVARAAGVSKGTLYLYFDSKESLFREMVRAKVVAALAESETYVRTYEGSPRALLVEIIRRTYARMRGEQMTTIARVVQGELGHFPELARFYFDEVILRARRLIEEVLARGVATGEFRPGTAGFAARGLSSLLVHTAQVQCFFHAFDPHGLTDEQAIEGVIDLYLHGVLAHPAERT
ncbi:MAG TPA: TetR/AcrR family transcriptional regulator [Gemmatimonadales bacterium]|nr:TetR/AcrR family transcriptional regulator [Gemmatimonadales bacterium]